MNLTPFRPLHRLQSLPSSATAAAQRAAHRVVPRRAFSSVIHSAPSHSQKDCLRLAFTYGACGTFASYLSMSYDGKVLVFKWSVPSPERFMFHSWCWSVAGMTSWMLFWAKPDALVRVAGSRVKCGLIHGAQTTTLALMLSFSTIGLFSLYFDVKDWQTQYGEWQQSRMMAHSPTSNLMADLSAKRTAAISPSNALIEEEGNEQGDEQVVHIVNIDELDSKRSGVQILNQKMESEPTQSAAERAVGSRPVLSSQGIANNMYEPTKLFFMGNAAIWMFCGSVTGMIAARILTNGIVLNPMNVTAGFGSLCLMELPMQRSDWELMLCDGDSNSRSGDGRDADADSDDHR